MNEYQESGQTLRDEFRKIHSSKINSFLRLRGKNELTQTKVQAWLNSLPEEERTDAKGWLEEGLSEEIDNLPE